MTRKLINLSIAFLLTHFVGGSLALASVISVVVGAPPFAPNVYIQAPPSFAIAEMGLQHEFKPFYTSGFPPSRDDPPPPVRTVLCTLENGPPGLTLTEHGVAHWIPQASEIGNTAEYTIRFRVLEAEAEIFTATKTFSAHVVADIPRMFEPATVIGYERSPIGWSKMWFSGYQPTDADLKFFRWSLIDPPPGVHIDTEGGLHWPDDRGFARAEPYILRVRIDYETASGGVSDEITYSRRVLPREATNDFAELRTQISPQTGGMLGFSVDSGDGWLAAGEPFPDTAWNASGNPNSGRVRLWKWNADRGTYSEHSIVQPEFVLGAQAFGTSVSISKKSSNHPTRLAVGAPDATRIATNGSTITQVGAVSVYACDDAGNWTKEAVLAPPVILQSLSFGECVAIHEDTLIASMEGMNSAGYGTGALAVFQHAASGWTVTQTLEAPDPAWGDSFSLPAAIDSEWIAASATGNDGMGNNAGAVHLYQTQGSQFEYRQTIHAPTPEIDSRFGERLLFHGSWLFVSSFRSQAARGVVQIFRLEDNVWTFRQSLDAPFATPGSAFGAALSCAGDILAVSAPGYLFGDPEIDGSQNPWRGITLFECDGETWNWSRQTTVNPDGSPENRTWGYAIAQISPDMTVAAMPDFRAYANEQYLPLAGRLFMHRWPEIIADPFAVVLDGLPQVGGERAGPNDDSNHNGIPNLIDWLFGQDPGAGLDSWTARAPASKRVFLKTQPGGGEVIVMIPELQPGLRHRIVIESSDDLIHWSPEPEARWGPLEDVRFPLPDGSNLLTYFHPVHVPAGNAAARFLRVAISH